MLEETLIWIQLLSALVLFYFIILNGMFLIYRKNGQQFIWKHTRHERNSKITYCGKHMCAYVQHGKYFKSLMASFFKKKKHTDVFIVLKDLVKKKKKTIKKSKNSLSNGIYKQTLFVNLCYRFFMHAKRTTSNYKLIHKLS